MQGDTALKLYNHTQTLYSPRPDEQSPLPHVVTSFLPCTKHPICPFSSFESVVTTPPSPPLGSATPLVVKSDPPLCLRHLLRVPSYASYALVIAIRGRSAVAPVGCPTSAPSVFKMFTTAENDPLLCGDRAKLDEVRLRAKVMWADKRCLLLRLISNLFLPSSPQDS